MPRFYFDVREGLARLHAAPRPVVHREPRPVLERGPELPEKTQSGQQIGEILV